MNTLLIEVEVENIYELNLRFKNPDYTLLMAEIPITKETIGESDQTKIKSLLIKGDCLLKLQNYSDSIDCFNKALEIDPENATALNAKAHGFRAKKKVAEAKETFEKANEINKEPNDADSLLNKAVSLIGLERYADASDYLIRCIELEPENEMAYYRLANCYQSLENHQKAIENYKLAIELNSNFLNAFNNMGVSCAQVELEKGLVCFNKTLERDKSHSNSLYNRAVISAELGNYADALKSFENLIEINPNDCEAYIMKANVLNGLKMYAEAVKNCDKAIKIDSQMSEVYLIKGVAKAKLKEFNEAVECFQKAGDSSKSLTLASKYKQHVLKYTKQERNLKKVSIRK